MEAKGLYIGALAKLAGTSAQMIRYYERKGLLREPLRTQAGYRLYAPETVRRIHFIKKAQNLGLSLDQIREILRLAYTGRSPCENVRKMLREQLDQIDRRIHQMQLFRDQSAEQLKKLAKMPERADSSAQVCQLIDAISLTSGFPTSSRVIRRRE